MRRILSALPLAGFALVNTASAVTVISTQPSWDGADFSWHFGNSLASSTFGQTFVVPSDSYLVSYTSWFAWAANDPFKFRLNIAEWSDASKSISIANSTPIFTSSSLTSPVEADGFKSYTVTMTLGLTQGKKYVAYYTVLDVPASGLGSAKMGTLSSNDYASGSFVYSNAADSSNLSNQVWNVDASSNDTAFTATFTADPRGVVPEPASMLALGVGLAAVVRRRRAR